MIQLGKFGESFTVNKKYFENIAEEDKRYLLSGFAIYFENRLCKINEVYEDSLSLSLVTANPEDFISINLATPEKIVFNSTAK